MVQQVTNGIKVSVKTSFIDSVTKNQSHQYLFSYSITIENQSNDSVQLLDRHWKIYDSLNGINIVEGAGVVGQKPILRPSQKYTYESHCVINSPLGAMKGYFSMVNFSTTNIFKVHIPTFQLNFNSALN